MKKTIVLDDDGEGNRIDAVIHYRRPTDQERINHRRQIMLAFEEEKKPDAVIQADQATYDLAKQLIFRVESKQKPPEWSTCETLREHIETYHYDDLLSIVQSLAPVVDGRSSAMAIQAAQQFFARQKTEADQTKK